MRLPWPGLLASTALTLSAIVSLARADAPAPEAVVTHYADMAEAMYADAHSAAVDLLKAVEALIAAPSEDTLNAARKTWLDARPWYQQTEGFRFGNPIVDAWEGRVNAWPLDEGLIDYVDTGKYGEESDENTLYVANVVANSSLQIGNEKVDATAITPDLIKSLHEAADSESNVAIGYHAVEFLLWGQDLNGTGPGAGNRPYTDFDTANCTNGNCDRRAAYLKAATDLLVADLQEMALNWKAEGAARKDVVAKPVNEALGVILTGLGSLSYGELAGERMKLGLILHDPEEEHDCFSDNTHNSHYYDVEGMWTIYSGTLKRRDGTVLDGPGIQDLAAVTAPDTQMKLDALMQDALAKFKAVKDKGDSGTMAYDQMIGANNPEGNALVQNAIDSLVVQTRGIEALVSAMNLAIKVEGSDSLDNPGAVSAQ
ncbi:imelysin family protein [Aestuariivirga sp.]|uniref:imelysin family protein n=1 Tax=Aestuariivirga sp. TaxID=2650926 RepID=UPI003592EBBC